MTINKKYFKTNKATWNEKVKVHAKSDMYDLEAFKAGKSSLMSYELDALGNVSGKSLLYLQCHFGRRRRMLQYCLDKFRYTMEFIGC